MDVIISDKDLSIVATRLGKEWRQLGLSELNLSTADLDSCQFGRSHLADVCVEMFCLWKTKNKDKATKRNFIQHLKNVPTDCSTWQCLEEGAKVYQHPLTLDDKVDILNKDLEQTYEKMEIACKLTPWGDEAFSVASVFNDVEITRTATCPFANKRTVCLKTYSELLTHRELKNIKRLLLEGDPGTGKTTTSLKILHDWLSQRKQGCKSPFGIDVFIMLQMKYLRTDLDLCENISAVLLSQKCCLTALDLHQVLESNKKVFLLCDGLDELSTVPSKCLSDVQDLLHRRKYHDAKSLISSRRFDTDLLKNCPNAKLRLNGFSTEQTKTYVIDKVFQENPSRGEAIIRYLEENGLLSDIGRVPLLLALLCDLMKTEAEYEQLDATPEKMTNLFTYLLQCLFIHDREKRIKSGEAVFSLDDWKLMLKRLGMIAFHGILGNQSLVWAKDDFVDEVGEETYNMAFGMGLIKEEAFEGGRNGKNGTPTQLIRRLGLHDKRQVMKVSFYHKLFQEKLAAEHFAHLVGKEELFKEDNINRISSSREASDLRYFLRFCCGEHPHAAAVILHHLHSIQVWDELIVECLYESEDTLNQIVASKKNEFVDIVESMCNKVVSVTGDHSEYYIRAATSLLKRAREMKILIPGLKLRHLHNNHVRNICSATSGFLTSLVIEPVETVKNLLDMIPDMPGLKKFAIEFFPFNNESDKLSALQWSARQPDLKIIEFRGKKMLFDKGFVQTGLNVLNELRNTRPDITVFLVSEEMFKECAQKLDINDGSRHRIEKWQYHLIHFEAKLMPLEDFLKELKVLWTGGNVHTRRYVKTLKKLRRSGFLSRTKYLRLIEEPWEEQEINFFKYQRLRFFSLQR